MSERRLVLRVKGMDCAEEAAALRREVGPLAGGQHNLQIDVLSGRLTVLPDAARGGDLPAADAVRRAAARAGLEAEPWSPDGALTAADRGRRGRRLAEAAPLAAATALLAAGLALDAAARGWGAALGAGEGDGSGPPAALAAYLAAIAVAGRRIAPRAWRAARRARPDMHLLMAIAVLGALAIGERFEAASVTLLFALALRLESWSVARARRAIQALMALAPTTARVIGPGEGQWREKPVAQIAPGDRLLVPPGERVPLDGVVEDGISNVNEAPITGEAMPVLKRPGAELFAGAINGEGALRMSVTRAAPDTTLARIIQLVEEAQSRRAPSEQWVDRFARRYTPAMLGLALAVALVPPLLGGGWSRWLYEALVILVIACPCALVIATPVTVVAGLAAAARAGVLIKGGAFLEAPARLRAVALDKTGTLTHAEPEVAQIVPLDGALTDPELLALAAALEAGSAHPLAGAVLRRAAAAGAVWRPASRLREQPGLGIEGIVDGRACWIGGRRLVEAQGAGSDALAAAAARLAHGGHTVLAVGAGPRALGLLGIADRLRAQAPGAVRGLKEAGIETVVMLTGDGEAAARRVAAAAGVDGYGFDLLPADKVRRLEMLAAKHRHVAMVGDGVNDAPAMAAAGLGIAMGAAGSDAALETADIALMTDDLTRLPWLVRHARRVVGVVRQNIVFALAVKALFLALALAGQATLWMAIAADMGASLAVIGNGLRLLDGRAGAARPHGAP